MNATQDSFPVDDFISSLWYNLGKPTKLGQDFWNKVVKDACGRDLSPLERVHLKAWIEENKYWLAQNFSARAKITLTHRLDLL
jgi:hypothetical protein